MPVFLGIENLTDKRPSWLKTARIGLLINQASVNHRLQNTRGILSKEGAKIRAILTPQHGFWGDRQANMDESPDESDPDLKIPLFSLYGERRDPPPELMREIDVLIIDLQDVGTRVYTFASTVAICMKAANNAGVKVVILDRPNPLGGLKIEGNILNLAYKSFVGLFPIPMRHGLTLGELALLAAKKFGYECDLEIIPMKGWRRKNLFPEYGLPWVPPSPNMPAFKTALVYPGQVLWEGTNLSEGRGTTRPFEIFGAPFVDAKIIREAIVECDLPGVILRETAFRPTFDKWSGKRCHGFHIHVSEPENFSPFRTTLVLLWAMIRNYPDNFQWLPPPYEYEYEKLPIDIILGSKRVRKAIESCISPLEVEKTWRTDLEEYRNLREDALLYI